MPHPFLAQYLFSLCVSSGLLIETAVGGGGVGELEWSLQVQLALDLYRPIPLHFSLAWFSTGHPAVEHCRKLVASDRMAFEQWQRRFGDTFGPGFSSTSPALMSSKRESKAGFRPSLFQNLVDSLRLGRL